jgi:hypothetical protein
MGKLKVVATVSLLAEAVAVCALFWRPRSSR